MQNLAQTIKTGISRHEKTGKCIKLKTETSREDSSDQLLSVDVKRLLKRQVNIVQNGP